MKKQLFTIDTTVENGNEKHTRVDAGKFTDPEEYQAKLDELVEAKTPRFVSVCYDTKREVHFNWNRNNYFTSDLKFTGKVPAWATKKANEETSKND